MSVIRQTSQLASFLVGVCLYTSKAKAHSPHGATETKNLIQQLQLVWCHTSGTRFRRDETRRDGLQPPRVVCSKALERKSVGSRLSILHAGKGRFRRRDQVFVNHRALFVCSGAYIFTLLENMDPNSTLLWKHACVDFRTMLFEYIYIQTHTPMFPAIGGLEEQCAYKIDLV